MKRVFIKPCEGRRPVFCRTSIPLSDEGAEVNLDTYWIRRERDGDITISEPRKAKASSARKPRGNTAPEG